MVGFAVPGEVDNAGFAFTISSDSREPWHTLSELGLLLEETIANQVATACSSSPASLNVPRAALVTGELARLVELPCLQHHHLLLAKTPADVLILVEEHCPTLLADLALMLVPPPGQFRKLKKTKDEIHKELELLVVLAMMACSARRSCSALPCWQCGCGTRVLVRIANMAEPIRLLLDH